jgi:hypothetical protein
METDSHYNFCAQLTHWESRIWPNTQRGGRMWNRESLQPYQALVRDCASVFQEWMVWGHSTVRKRFKSSGSDQGPRDWKSTELVTTLSFIANHPQGIAFWLWRTQQIGKEQKRIGEWLTHTSTYMHTHTCMPANTKQALQMHH